MFQKEWKGEWNQWGFFLLQNKKKEERGKPKVIFLVYLIVVCEGRVIELLQLFFFSFEEGIIKSLAYYFLIFFSQLKMMFSLHCDTPT